MRKWMAAMLIASIMLTGCQLAQGNGPQESREDRMVGVFVTEDYMSLFNLEAYLQDHPEMLGGGTITDGKEYEGRLYATEVREEQTLSDGSKVYTSSYVFEGLEGVWAYEYEGRTELEDGTVYNTFTAGETSPGFLAGGFEETEQGGGLSFDGEIYVSAAQERAEFYPNPVYQDQEGRIYLTPGQGMSAQMGSGMKMASTLEQSFTVTGPDGTVREETRKFRVAFHGVDLANTITLIQMDGENRVVAKDSYGPGELPEVVALEEHCAYLMVEEQGREEARRTLAEPGTEEFRIMVQGEQGYCVYRNVTLDWGA